MTVIADELETTMSIEDHTIRWAVLRIKNNPEAKQGSSLRIEDGAWLVILTLKDYESTQGALAVSISGTFPTFMPFRRCLISESGTCEEIPSDLTK